DFMAGGTDGAVQTDFPTCVSQVYGQQDAAMVFEADFVAANAAEAGATVGEDAQAFPFPAVGEEPPVVVGGDIAVAMSENEGTQELLAFLASAEAQSTWAGLGGYLSANSQVESSAYADAFTQQLSQTILEAGDSAVAMSEEGGTQELLALHASAEAQSTWAGLGRFLSANSQVGFSAYADEFPQAPSETILEAGDSVRFDMADQVPSQFGATEG